MGNRHFSNGAPLISCNRTVSIPLQPTSIFCIFLDFSRFFALCFFGASMKILKINKMSLMSNSGHSGSCLHHGTREKRVRQMGFLKMEKMLQSQTCMLDSNPNQTQWNLLPSKPESYCITYHPLLTLKSW